MKSNESLDEKKVKKLCYQCIEEEYLRDEVKHKGQVSLCSYCSQSLECLTVGEISERVDIAFEQHFRRTSDQPTAWQYSMLSDRESNYNWERDGEPVVWAIANSAGISETAAQDIQEILDDNYADFDSAAMGEETEFCSDSYYEEKGPCDVIWQMEWEEFERSLKTEARFFSLIATKHLASIFGGIDKMITTAGQPLVVEAGPNTKLNSLYRARVFQSEEMLQNALCRPDIHLGSPPSALANAGRMNARGISVFYGATGSDVAIAEVRPPVGSQVIVSYFEIIKSLRLLDLTALDSVAEDGSIFDHEWAERLERATFLRSLSKRISRPVMPEDEVFEYLPTQAIADYLATQNDPVLDGIIFPSVQAKGTELNVVLFHKAARVEAMDIEEGTEINARTGHLSEDGWEVDYTVIESIDPKTVLREKDREEQLSPMEAFFVGALNNNEKDYRDITLRIDLQSVTVHLVNSVQFHCEEHVVQRFQFEKQT